MSDAKKVLDSMVSIFSCEDGGLEFIKVRFGLEALYKQADEGDRAAIEIINRIESVNNLFNYLKRN